MTSEKYTGMYVTDIKDLTIEPLAQINEGTAGMAVPFFKKKWWGYELTYKNDSQYCAKLLQMSPSGSTSMHFHIDKHETLILVDGELHVDYIDNKETKTIALSKNQALVVPPGFPHRLYTKDTSATIVEASTLDKETDSIRIS